MIRNKGCTKRRDCFFVFDNLLGDSDWAQRLRRRVIQSSSHRFNTVITGPSGTGKRLIARAIHEHSPRRSLPFIPVDCAVLPGELLDAELFGKAYRETTTLGCLRAATGGTIYLANIDQLDMDSQDKLLRALELRSVTPVNCRERFNIDARIIAGSTAHLEQLVRAGRFRSSLYQRLCVLQLETTALHSRPGDIAPIAHHLVAKLTFERGEDRKELTAEALERLAAYHWPGNVSELQRVLDDAITHSKTSMIAVEDLGIKSDDIRSTWLSLADMEAKHIRETMALANGVTELAATMLGIDPDELAFKIANLGLSFNSD